MSINIPYISKEAVESVCDSFANNEFSGFIGSPHENIYTLLPKKSADIRNIFPPKNFLGGRKVRGLEADWSEYFKTDYSISVNSATSGLITSILALQINNWGTVGTTAFSFTASTAAIALAGYFPYFLDVDLDTFCISPYEIEKHAELINGILYVSWAGNAGDLCLVKSFCESFNCFLIEDASQSIGSKYDNKFIGTFGDIGIFSLNEPKNLQTGEGGIIISNDEKLAVRSRLIRNHGENIVRKEDEWLHDIIGYNFRMTESTATIGLENLKVLDLLNEKRKNNYEYLVNELKEYQDVLVPQVITNSHFYPYIAAFRWVDKKLSRNDLARRLKMGGIPVSTGLHRLLCDHPCYSGKVNTNLPNTRLLNDQYLGFYQIGFPNNLADMNEIVSAFKKILNRR
jgi:dTDP-4-amino-4,6-dideoxygalactose transaminase